MTATFSTLKHLCISEDWDEIEGARGPELQPHIPLLISLYWELDSWPQKLAVIQLLQDHSEPAFRDVMLDCLRAPNVDDWLQDTIELTKAVALGFIAEEYDSFYTYYEDRELLHQTIAAVLAANKRVQVEAEFNEVVEVQAAPANLLEAVIAGDLDAMREFLKKGADPNQFTENGPTKGCTLLMMAIMHDQVDASWLLIEAGAAPAGCRKDSLQNALGFAASGGHREICAYLMDHGADMDCLDNWGGSVVSTAAQLGHMGILEDAISRGAMIDAPYHDNRNAIWFAAQAGQTNAVLRLLDAGALLNIHVTGSAPIHLACKNNHLEMVNALIKRGADLNSVSTCQLKQTPLMMAVQGGYPSIVRQLLAAGASSKMPGLFRRSAVHLAKDKRADEIRAVFAEFADSKR